MNKASARTEARALLAGADPRVSAELVRMAAGLSDFQKARNVVLYSAAGQEADPAGLLSFCAGKRVAYPVCDGRGGMIAAIPCGGWERNRFGILEPRLAESLVMPADTIDAVLVPGLAFSSSGRRLGRGAGYYDRFLPLCANAARIGFAYEVQMLPFEADPHDVAMHIVVTEKYVYIASLNQEL